MLIRTGTNHNICLFFFFLFFNSLQKINWEDLAAKKVPAPFKPVIRDELDVSNFADEFTEMDPTYSPAALPQNCDRIFQVGGRSGMLRQAQAILYFIFYFIFICRDSCFAVYRQEGSFVLLAGHCTGQHFYLHLLCADVCLSSGCRQKNVRKC